RPRSPAAPCCLVQLGFGFKLWHSLTNSLILLPFAFDGVSVCFAAAARREVEDVLSAEAVVQCPVRGEASSPAFGRGEVAVQRLVRGEVQRPVSGEGVRPGVKLPSSVLSGVKSSVRSVVKVFGLG
ncbi:unnamed protein product, partial [Urochloa humidicola]